MSLELLLIVTILLCVVGGVLGWVASNFCDRSR